jgi:dipeptidase D
VQNETLMMDDSVYSGLSPRELWRHFAALNHIPRPSGQETAACTYVRRIAEAADAVAVADARGNVIVRVSATHVSAAGAPVVAIQAHLDMVCEKRPGVEHDFNVDPIRSRCEGGCIFANGTTLGADNGIGAAAALALLTEPGLRHGPLELIFTVEEETGLHGAMALDPALVNARLLINLDSEDPDELTVGCAGGAGVTLRLPVTREAAPRTWAGREVVVSGLKGGHSGVQIHERLANAIKLLASTLNAVREAEIGFHLAAINGGSAHNAIPRDAVAHIIVAPDAVPELEAVVTRMNTALRAEWDKDEPGLLVEAREASVPERVLADENRDAVLRLLRELPHGVVSMSQTFAGKVETSSNLAGVHTRRDVVEIATSSRSFVIAELQKVQMRIQALGAQAGAKTEVHDGYPGWEPDPQSRLLQVAERVYEQVNGKPPQVQIVHAGLECGIIISKLPGMEAISFGPLIRGAHTPEEHVSIATVNSTWNLLVALLAALAQPAPA